MPKYQFQYTKCGTVIREIREVYSVPKFSEHDEDYDYILGQIKVEQMELPYEV